MAGYDKEQIINEFKVSGKAYTTFHSQKHGEAKAKGDDFPALMTFRGWLLDAGLIVEKGKSGGSEAVVGGGATVSVDAEYLEFLKDHLPAEIKADPENSFLKWKVKRLEEQVRQLQLQK